MRPTRLRLRNFTAFSDLDLEFGGGIEVFVGANGAGKTHLMKVGYAACDVARSGGDFAQKLVRVPSVGPVPGSAGPKAAGNQLGRGGGR